MIFRSALLVCLLLAGALYAEEKFCVDGGEGSCVFNEEYRSPAENEESSSTSPDKGTSRKRFDSTTTAIQELREQSAMYGQVQAVDDRATQIKLAEINAYMKQTVFTNPDYQAVKRDCRNRDELCTFWASVGECKNNPHYMKLQCAPACKSCDQLRYEVRCPYDDSKPRAWEKEGDLQQFFERITTDPSYNVTIITQPGMASGTYDDSPWIVTIDDFLTANECETLIGLGAEEGYERSEDVGGRQFDGSYGSITSTGRTSSNAWCRSGCYIHPTTKQIINKLEQLTQIDDANSEFLQILQYQKGQFYHEHHDFIQHQVQRPYGPRILTVFLYLNNVEAGGGTRFTRLDKTVLPRRGRALIWPSVRDSNPNRQDPRTQHEALPVEEGIKYGANAWIHQRDFKTPFYKHCT